VEVAVEQGGLFPPWVRRLQPAGTARAWQALGINPGADRFCLDWEPGSAQPGDGRWHHALAVHGRDRFGSPRCWLG